MAELTTTLHDAERLFEDKVKSLQAEMGHAQKETRAAASERDNALREVTTLQQERQQLVDDLTRAKDEKQRIMDTLAEHRKNVEASLAKREAAATLVIDKANALTAKLVDAAKLVNQRQAQLVGIKRTLLEEIATGLPGLATAFQHATATLTQVPDGQPLDVKAFGSSV